MLKPNPSLFVAALYLLLVPACNTKPAAETAAESTEVAPGSDPNALTAAEVAEGWENLFDGTSTAAWRGYNRPDFPGQGWTVADGELRVEHSGNGEAGGAGGDIITRKKYKDFDFVVQYALTDTSNSGAFYLVQELPDTPIWHSAPEFQMLDDATYREIMDLTPEQFTGTNYGMHAQPKDFSNRIGEWNTARITKRGNEVEHYLNGHLVVRYTLHDADWDARLAKSKFKDYPSYASVDEGHLGLQDHGHLVRFRGMKVRAL